MLQERVTGVVVEQAGKEQVFTDFLLAARKDRVANCVKFGTAGIEGACPGLIG